MQYYYAIVGLGHVIRDNRPNLEVPTQLAELLHPKECLTDCLGDSTMTKGSVIITALFLWMCFKEGSYVILYVYN